MRGTFADALQLEIVDIAATAALGVHELVIQDSEREIDLLAHGLPSAR